jgi:hypothetical protein
MGDLQGRVLLTTVFNLRALVSEVYISKRFFSVAQNHTYVEGKMFRYYKIISVLNTDISSHNWRIKFTKHVQI